MSVLSMALDPNRSGSLQLERKGVLTEIANRKYRKTFVAVTDDLRDGPVTLRAYFAAPKPGEPYVLGNDSDPLATCNDIRCEATGSPFVWHVVAEYDTARIATAILDSPLNVPAEIGWSFAQRELPFFFDSTGIPVTNSSSEAFDPPPSVEDSQPVLTIVRNEASFSISNAVAYQNAVNSDTFATQPAGYAKLASYVGVRQADIGFAYYKVTYEIHFRRETWARFILDAGFRDSAGLTFRDPIDNTPYSNATLLNGQGERLSKGTTTLTAAVSTVNDLTLSVTDGTTHFPSGPAYPPSWYFAVKIDSEVFLVTGGFRTNTWQVTRGYAGTTPATHSNGATVKLQPFYLRYQPYKVLPFSALALPVVS